jgi:hypothetical protein
VGDLVGERARRRQRRLLLERGRLREAEGVDRITQQRHLELQGVTVLMAELAADLAQHLEHLPGPDELGRAQLAGAAGEVGLEVGNRAQGAGDGDGLQKLGGVFDRRKQVEQVVLKLGQVLQHVPGSGLEEVDDPDVVVGVDQDVGGVEVAVHIGHVVVVVRRQPVVGQEVVVELADVGQRHPSGEVEHLLAGISSDGGDTVADRRPKFRRELVVLEKRHAFVAGRGVERAEDFFKGAPHDRDDAARCRIGGEHRLQRVDLALSHGGVGVLEAGPVAQVGEAADAGGVVAEHALDLLEGGPLLGDGAVRAQLDHGRRLAVA